MEEISTENAKVSDSGYSNTCSNSQSQRRYVLSVYLIFFKYFELILLCDINFNMAPWILNYEF